VDNIKTP